MVPKPIGLMPSAGPTKPWCSQVPFVGPPDVRTAGAPRRAVCIIRLYLHGLRLGARMSAPLIQVMRIGQFFENQ